MIALVIGGAPSVWAELEAARQLVGSRHHITVAANLAGIHFTGRLDAWATLHPDHLASWQSQRAAAGRNADARTFTPDLTAERWPGSSGLYALQVALFDMGASAAILCGVPMDRQAGHFIHPGAWASTTDYRRAFELALPTVGARTRSFGGWTRDLFGEPTTTWLDAISTARPLGSSAPAGAKPMHTIENTGTADKSFWHTDIETGLRKLAHLAPGDAGPFNIDPNHKAFHDKALKVTEIPEVREPVTKKAPAKAQEPATAPEA